MSIVEPGTPSQGASDWTIPMPSTFFEAKLSDRERWVFQALEYRARLNPWCFMSYRDIARLTQKSLRSVQRIIADLAAKGWVRPVHMGSIHSTHAGIIMLRRIHEKFPAATTPEQVEAAEQWLRFRRTARAKGLRCDNSVAQKEYPGLTGIPLAVSLPVSEHENVVAAPVNPLEVDDDDTNISRWTALLARIADPMAPRGSKAKSVNAAAKWLCDYYIDDESLGGFAGLLWQIHDNQCDPRVMVDVFWEVHEAATEGVVRGTPGGMFYGRVKGRWAARAFDEELEMTRAN